VKPKLIIGNKNYSSWSLRAWLLLREADIDFDEHRIALDVEDTARQIAEFSPAGKVPVLLLDDMAVWDSLAIAETVAERWPDKRLWPEDAAACAQHQCRNAFGLRGTSFPDADELPCHGASRCTARRTDQ
jgi:glutathione S-transferase